MTHRFHPKTYTDRNLSQLSDLAGVLRTEFRKNALFRDSDSSKIDWAIEEIIHLRKPLTVAYLAVSDTNYGVGVHAVFTSLIEAKAAFPGVWTVGYDDQWIHRSKGDWDVYLIKCVPNHVGGRWLVHDGR